MILLALLSSLLYILAFPKFNIASLAWVSLMPLATVALTQSPRSAFRTGWLCGTAASMGLLYWILITFSAAHLSLMLSIPCWILLSGYLGLYWGGWSAFLSMMNRKRTTDSSQSIPAAALPAALRAGFPWLGAAAWVALEYLRTFFLSGFPWTLLGDSQVHHLALIQVASVTGVYGVSGLVVLLSLTLTQLFQENASEASQWTNTGLTTVLILSVWFGGHRRLTHDPIYNPAQRNIKIALLQGNIDQYKKWDVVFEESIKETYADLALTATHTHPDLIIWPETSVPGYLPQDKELTSWLRHLVQATHANHIVGAPAQEGDNAYNAAFALNPQGDVIGSYDKQHLVPFGEVVPFASVLGRFIHVLNDLGGFTAGQHCALLPVAGTSVGVSICYEAIFPQLVRAQARAGATLLANITNDGWYMKTAAPYQHFAPNIFRAIENKRWLIRADNTGISAVISPRGEVLMASPIFESALLIDTVQPINALTFYTHHGDLFAWACILVTLLASFTILF